MGPFPHFGVGGFSPSAPLTSPLIRTYYNYIGVTTSASNTSNTTNKDISLQEGKNQCLEFAIRALRGRTSSLLCEKTRFTGVHVAGEL